MAKKGRQARLRRGGRQGDFLLVVGGPHAVSAAVEGAGRLRRVMVEEGASRRIRTLAARARELGVPVSEAARGECDRLAGSRSQGVAAEIDYAYASFDAVVEDPNPGRLLVFLDAISDPHNLGAIIRTAEAAASSAVVLPARRSVGVTAAVVRASAGAALWLPVCRVGNLARALDKARQAGYWVLGLDQDGPGELRRPAHDRVALVVGSEGEGLGRLVSERCDELVHIPMAGRTASLNASVAAALAIYRLREGFF